MTTKRKNWTTTNMDAVNGQIASWRWDGHHQTQNFILIISFFVSIHIQPEKVEEKTEYDVLHSKLAKISVRTVVIKCPLKFLERF